MWLAGSAGDRCVSSKTITEMGLSAVVANVIKLLYKSHPYNLTLGLDVVLLHQDRKKGQENVWTT